MILKDGQLQMEDNDFYNLDETLSEIIINSLKEFKERCNSFPSEFAKPTKEFPNGTIPTEEAHAAWLSTIDEMIFGFSFDDDENIERTVNGIECPYDYSSPDWVDENRVFKPVIKPGFTEEDCQAYIEARNISDADHENRKFKGRTLFAKYFNHLWE